MKCYAHRTADAVAICRACGRAMCADCAQETTGEPLVVCGPACRASAAKKDLLDQLLVRHYEATAYGYRGLRLAFYCLGWVVIAAPFPIAILNLRFFLDDKGAWAVLGAIWVMGIGCLAMGRFALHPVWKKYEGILRQLEPRQEDKVP